MFTSGGGSHATYPIMLLYTAIECPSGSWAKFTWNLPPGVEQTDRQIRVKTLASRTTWQAVIIHNDSTHYGFYSVDLRLWHVFGFYLEHNVQNSDK